jgi:hypothetical protein
MFCLVSFDLLLNVMVGQRARWKKGFTRPGLFLLQLLKRSKRGGAESMLLSSLCEGGGPTSTSVNLTHFFCVGIIMCRWIVI